MDTSPCEPCDHVKRVTRLPKQQAERPTHEDLKISRSHVVKRPRGDLVTWSTCQHLSISMSRCEHQHKFINTSTKSAHQHTSSSANQHTNSLENHGTTARQHNHTPSTTPCAPFPICLFGVPSLLCGFMNHVRQSSAEERVGQRNLSLWLRSRRPSGACHHSNVC